MDRALELNLIEELLGLREAKTHFLDQAIEFNSVDHYQSEIIFNKERESILLGSPRWRRMCAKYLTPVIL